MNTFACCWATKSCRRLAGSRLVSFTTARSKPSRSSLPSEQQRRPDETGDDAEEVKHAQAHQPVQRIRIGKGPEGSYVRVHDPVEYRMKKPAENSAHRRNRQSVLGGKRLGDQIARSGPPLSDLRDNQAAKQSDQGTKKKSVCLPVDRIFSAQQVVARFEVDDDLRQGVRRHGELTRRGGLDQQARTEVKGSGRHGATANLGVGQRFRLGHSTSSGRSSMRQPLKVGLKKIVPHTF